MNKKIRVAVGLAVFIAGGFAGSFFLAASGEEPLALPEGVGTGKVLSVHHYSLKAGVNPKDFEKFVAQEWLPIAGRTPGVELTLMKGERGQRIGHYILAYEMNSLYVRDYYWPPPGQASEALKAADAKCGTECEKIWNKFMTYAERTEFTDYVGITRK